MTNQKGIADISDEELEALGGGTLPRVQSAPGRLENIAEQSTSTIGGLIGRKRPLDALQLPEKKIRVEPSTQGPLSSPKNWFPGGA